MPNLLRRLIIKQTHANVLGRITPSDIPDRAVIICFIFITIGRAEEIYFGTARTDSLRPVENIAIRRIRRIRKRVCCLIDEGGAQAQVRFWDKGAGDGQVNAYFFVLYDYVYAVRALDVAECSGAGVACCLFFVAAFVP